MMNYLRVGFYPADYLNLVYKYYEQCGRAYFCTYYRLDLQNSNCDKEVLDAMSYRVLGDWSGLVWQKILLVPIYYTDQITPNFSADERGVGKFDQQSSFVIPSEYGFTPTFRDFITFSEPELNPDSDKQILYQVTNLQRATNTPITFWKLSIDVSNYKKPEIEEHVYETFTFFDYEKRVYPNLTSIDMYTLMSINEDVKINDYLENVTGYFYGV